MIQLELFPEIKSLSEEVSSYKDSSDRVRRCVFAKVGELDKKTDQRFNELLAEIEELKAFADEVRKAQFSFECAS